MDENVTDITERRGQQIAMEAEYAPPFDDKGRQLVESMSDRELLEELVLWTRTTSDTVEQLAEQMKSNPMSMFKMMGLIR